MTRTNEELELLLQNIKQYSYKIDYENRDRTKKQKGRKYPLKAGYSTYTRKPVRDILKWMDAVEDLLSDILEILSHEQEREPPNSL